jgi:RND family efflux transporter MFP subunit
MKRPRDIARTLSCLVLLFLAGLSLGCGGTPTPEEPTPPAPVKWMEARQLMLEEWTELLGTTQPLPELAARITAPVEGRVVAVLPGAKSKGIVEGQRVQKGDVIVELDARLVTANRDKVKATLKELDDQEKRARVAVDLAQIEVSRLKKLRSQGVTVAESEIQKAQLTLEDAGLQLEGLKTKKETGKAELEGLEVQLSLYRLTAPINGHLGRILVNPGQTLAVGTQVADVINVDKQVDILCFVPPAVAKRLQKGQLARLGALEEKLVGPAASVAGKIEFVADQAELDTGNFAVKVRFPNDKLKLRANTTVRVRVLTAPGRSCLALPNAAIMEDEDPPSVIVVEDIKKFIKTKDDKEIEITEDNEANKPEGKELEKGKARKLQVTLGIRDRVLRLVEIISVNDRENKWKGNLETAKFVFERAQGVRTGDVVKMEEEDEEEE